MPIGYRLALSRDGAYGPGYGSWRGPVGAKSQERQHVGEVDESFRLVPLGPCQLSVAALFVEQVLQATVDALGTVV